MYLNEKSFDARKDPEFEAALKVLFKYIDYRPKLIIDTSNVPDVACVVRKIIQEASYPRRSTPTYKICTPSYCKFVQMRKEFSDAPWLTAYHCLPVKTEDAIEFIENDDMLIHHERFLDIRIDAEDPIPFYTTEVKGMLFGDKRLPKDNFFGREYKPKTKKMSMFVLGGVGGIGWLEFQKMLLAVGRRKFYFLLKDIGHIKHFRSLQYVEEDKMCRVMRMREGQWALCVHNSAPHVTARWKDDIRVFPYEEEYEE